MSGVVSSSSVGFVRFLEPLLALDGVAADARFFFGGGTGVTGLSEVVSSSSVGFARFLEPLLALDGADLAPILAFFKGTNVDLSISLSFFRFVP